MIAWKNCSLNHPPRVSSRLLYRMLPNVGSLPTVTAFESAIRNFEFDTDCCPFCKFLAEPKAKHDGWNFPYGHSELLQVMTVSSFGARQKHTSSSLGLLMGKVHFLVYHLPRISGRIQPLQKASSFGTTVSKCFKSGWLRSLTICGSLSGLMAHTTKSQCFLSFKVNSYYCSWK